MMCFAYKQQQVEIEELKFHYANSAVNLLANVNGGLSKSDVLFELLSKLRGSDLTMKQVQLNQTATMMERYEEHTGLRFGSPEMEKAIDATVAALEGRS